MNQEPRNPGKRRPASGRASPPAASCLRGSITSVVCSSWVPAFLIVAVSFLSLPGPLSTAAAAPTDPSAADAGEHYVKSEQLIRMRDGVRLFTAIYRPRDTSRKYPFLMKRSPYSARPYGEDQYPRVVGPSRHAMAERFIFVYQDVRGRYLSEGRYDNMRPHVPGDGGIDESSDTYDTIEWLLQNVPGHNGKVGQWGISYPGFYAAASLPEAHPALVAVSPQAPIADFFFDDFHHMGAFTLIYWQISSVFGYQKDGPKTSAWYPYVSPPTRDAYQFYLELGALKNSSKYYDERHTFWQQIVEHPNYDEFWQRRNILPHLKDLHSAVLTVGGWFDAEDLYGPLQIYRAIEKNNPGLFNVLVMGPWSHGGWARGRGMQTVGDIDFGEDLSDRYQREVELPFFVHFLKGKGQADLAEALMFDTGQKEWHRFAEWPPPTRERRLYFIGGGGLRFDPPAESERAESRFLSDPSQPVPYREKPVLVGTPRRYMTEDQRFASKRDDVLTFQTPVLTEDVTLAGPLVAHLNVSTTGTAADWIVKLIDVYPDDTPPNPRHPDVEFGGYQQMVRSEAMRGRFRNSFEKPEPFVPNRVTAVGVPLQDVLHTFKKGHRIMVQVQSTWFPLIDRNPQRYVDNIYRADEEDFMAATHRLYHSAEHPSAVELSVLEPSR